ncbi:hypothetical protein [Bradyrhizobium sp. Tv2a-2]|uniref:hypothetical protein n=1 Tax=Bradyrhizobium sp. Tv2a-2 TaxID=113395 RepID=UPI0012EBE212|nr:hypothetical protein [Bradyrhizobium sp. Tv2a-2]
MAAFAASSSLVLDRQVLASPAKSNVVTAVTTNSVVLGTAIEGGMFKNIALSLNSLQSASGYAYPAILDGNGYPTATPTYNIFGLVNFPSTLLPTDQIVVKFNGTGTIQLARGAPGFTIVSGGTFVSGSPSFNLTISGTNPRVVFQFNSSVSSSVTFNFLAGSKFSGMSSLVICKLADEAAIDAATTPEQMFNDQYVAIYQSLNPGVLRSMGWTNPNFGNVSQSRYIAPWQTSLNISSQRWAPGAWAGTTTGTNSYQSASQPDAGKTYADGEMIQLQFAAANTSSAVTLNSGGRGAIPLLVGSGYGTGQALPVGAIAAGSLATLTYDAVLKAFMWQQDGQTPCIPFELQIGFANRINSNYWCNIPAYFDDASVSAIATMVRTRLSSTRTAYFEYANEVWNWSFPVTPWAAAKGAALGFPSDNNRQVYGWFALRHSQVMQGVVTAWSPRSTSQLRRVLAFQAFGPTAATATYRLGGADLNGANYPSYSSRGYQSYNAAPNRPVDFCDVLSYATYYSGAQCTNFDANYLQNGASNIAGLLAAADSYASGVASLMSSGLAFLDNDIRAGVLANGAAGSQTLLSLSSSANGIGVYQAWNAIAKLFNKSVECYEGGHESWFPSTQACTAMGISTSYGGPTGKIAKLLNGYKMSSAFQSLVNDQIRQFMSMPTSTRAAWLIIPGPNQWALSTGDSYAIKYASWNAVSVLDHS